MKDNYKFKWLAAGVFVLMVGTAWYFWAMSREKYLHITPHMSDEAGAMLGEFKMDEEDGTLVKALPEGFRSEPKKEIGVGIMLLPLEINTNQWLSGQVILKGDPPPARPLLMDPECSALAKKANPELQPLTRDYVIGTEGGLADVVVALVKFEGEIAEQTHDPLSITVEGCQLRPMVVACQPGQVLRIKNLDQELHELLTGKASEKNDPTGEMLFPGGLPIELSYSTPEENIRLHMVGRLWIEAYATVVDHPFFSVTDSNGVFRIPLPPQGTYQLKAFHRKLKPVVKVVSIERGTNAKLDFELLFEN